MKRETERKREREKEIAEECKGLYECVYLCDLLQ